MSRWGVKIGLVVLLILLMAVATVNADDVPVTFYHNNIPVADLIISGVKDKINKTTNKGTINVTYRDVFEIQIEKVYGIVKDGKIDILIYRADGKLIESWNDKKAGDIITVDTAKVGKEGMKPAIYYIAVRFDSIILKSYENATPRFNLSVDPTEYEKPIIELKVKNRENTVAIGDKLIIKVTVWGANKFEWYLRDGRIIKEMIVTGG